VSEARCAAIARYGAQVVCVPGNYDDSVRHAAAQAQRNGWTVVSDTTYEGYREIPIDVMHGYGVLAQEVIRSLGDQPPTHVFVQAGGGGLAAAVCAAFWIAWQARRPELLIVKPKAAACHFASAAAGQPVAVTGDLDTAWRDWPAAKCRPRRRRRVLGARRRLCGRRAAAVALPRSRTGRAPPPLRLVALSPRR
jgi:diaminopropionate ammonia-lyase